MNIYTQPVPTVIAPDAASPLPLQNAADAPDHRREDFTMHLNKKPEPTDDEFTWRGVPWSALNE